MLVPLSILMVVALSSCGIEQRETTQNESEQKNASVQEMISKNEVKPELTSTNTRETTSSENRNTDVHLNFPNYSQINSSAQIFDAYISDATKKFTDESYNNLFNKELVDKDSLIELSNTVYFKDKKSVYCHPWCQFEESDWINPKLFKWILPIESFTWTSYFATDWKNIFYWGKKVENWDIKSLKFKIFWDGSILASDKNNLYIGMNQIINWKNVQDLEMIDDRCYKDNVYVICNYFDWGGTMYRIVEWADPMSYTALDFMANAMSYFWYKDKNAIYFSWNKMEDLDVNTFQVLNDWMYAKDKNWVYCRDEKIEWADTLTFQTISSNNQALSNWWHYAKDKNTVYKGCSKIEWIHPDWVTINPS